jgi:hypothetical protein
MRMADTHTASPASDDKRVLEEALAGLQETASQFGAHASTTHEQDSNMPATSLRSQANSERPSMLAAFLSAMRRLKQLRYETESWNWRVVEAARLHTRMQCDLSAMGAAFRSCRRNARSDSMAARSLVCQTSGKRAYSRKSFKRQVDLTKALCGWPNSWDKQAAVYCWCRSRWLPMMSPKPTTNRAKRYDKAPWPAPVLWMAGPLAAQRLR